MRNLTQLLNAPLEAEDISSIKDRLLTGLNNITISFTSSEDIGELPSIISALEAITLNDISDITSLINGVMGYFKMGKSCDLSAEIGKFPTRDEFCNLTLGRAYMKNALTCPIHQETHDMYTYIFHDLINPTNYTWSDEDMENEYTDQYERQGKNIGKKSGKAHFKPKGPMDIDYGE